jgi:invasion protein IalB
MRNSALPQALLALLAIVTGSAVAFAQADQPRQIDAAFLWQVLAAGPPDNPVCYVTHKPEAVVQAGQRAGPRPMLMVAWRPAKASANVVTVFTAYRFKPGSEAILEFSPQLSFRLFTTRDTAWAATSEDDTAIMQAMRLGQTVTVRGTSEAGAAVSDTFSLMGFTAASFRAIQACPQR